MKAYQFKIALKNSKPPIWRRCIVPSGITFSQLSLLLNEIMGWSGSHLSKYEFFHSKIELMEDDGFDYFDAPWDYELYDSAKMYIDEFMENEDWFTYVYDFGDWWTHRVTVEKVIEDYEYNYAKVLKFKGDCPPEDIGGMDMYQMFLSGDFEEMTGVPVEEIPQFTYDIEEVNETLERDYFIKWTHKGETRLATDIYEDVVKGKGLKGCLNPVNKYEQFDIYDRFVEEDERIDFDDYRYEMNDIERAKFEKDMRKLQKLLTEYKKQHEENLAKMVDNWFDEQHKYETLQYRLLNFTKEDLISIGEIHGLVLKQSWNKEKMSQVLSEKILNPVEFKSNISRLDEEEIKAFEKAIKHNRQKIDESEYMLYDKLYDWAYVLITIDNVVEVPWDIANLYESINTKEFKKTRKYDNWINKCIVYLEYYYGCAPISVMLKLVNEKAGLRLNEAEFREKLADFTDKVTVADDYIVANELMNNGNYKQFMKWQGMDKSYYIPPVDEIEFFFDFSLYKPSKHDKEMAKFLEKLCGDAEHAVFVETLIQRKIYNEERMQDIINMMEDEGIFFRSQKDVEKFISIFNNLWNNTRLLANKGHTPLEIASEIPVHTGKAPTIVPVSSEAAKLLEDCKSGLEGIGVKVDVDSTAKKMSVMDITSNGEVVKKREKKVYPNDPCPCGSGKKFKKCCGR